MLTQSFSISGYTVRKPNGQEIWANLPLLNKILFDCCTFLTLWSRFAATFIRFFSFNLSVSSLEALIWGQRIYFLLYSSTTGDRLENAERQEKSLIRKYITKTHSSSTKQKYTLHTNSGVSKKYQTVNEIYVQIQI